MPSLVFSNPVVKSLKTEKSQEDFYDKAFPGPGSLGVRVSKTGNKSWFLLKNKKRTTLGSWPELDHPGAVEVALSRPTAKVKAPSSVAELVEMFETRHVQERLSAKTVEEYKRIARKEVLPAIGSLKLATLKPGPILGLLEDIRFERKKDVQADRVRGYLSSLFSFALKRDYIKSNPVSEIEPDTPAPRKQKTLSIEELVSIWFEVEKLREPFARLIRASILLAQKPTKLATLKREQLDGNKLFLGSRYGIGVSPLLREQFGDGNYLFASIRGGPISDVSRQMSALPCTSSELQASVLFNMHCTPEERDILKGKKEGEISEKLNQWQAEISVRLGSVPSNVVPLRPIRRPRALK